MADNDLSPEAAKLLAARQAALEELKAIDGNERAVSDHAVVRLANARLYESSITARMLGGEYITAAEFKAAADMVEAARSAAPVTPTITVRYVAATDTAPPDAAAVDTLVRCRRCGWRPADGDRVSRCYVCNWKRGDDTKKPWKPVPLVAPSDATATEGKGIPEPAKAAGTRPALPAPKAKQDVKREPRHVGGIHDQPGARMRVHDEPWRGHVGTVDNPS